jgi:diguanylate cyclase (GGDEF)-like protein/PAS domain S-box-containing protein
VAGVGTWDWDLASGAVRWSRSSEATGAAPGFGGTLASFLEIVHPDDRQRVRQALARATEGAEKVEFCFRLVRPDGQVRWQGVSGGVVRGRSGRPAQVNGLIRDVTALMTADRRLLAAEARYRTLVEQLPMASYVERLDEESASYMSPQIADLLGYTAEQWVADRGFFARTLHPEDRDRVLSEVAAMHRSGQSLECEYRLLDRTGRVVWIHDASVVVRDEDGNPSYAQGYMIDISERKRAEEDLHRSELRLREQMERAKHQALHDGLTGLPNRTLFQDRIEQALRTGERTRTGFAVMLIDLDRFKEVNDTLGHHCGDLLLQHVAERLRAGLRRSDTVARLGGDEFGVLAPGLTDPDQARMLADKLRQELQQPMEVAGLALEVEASVGIALYPEHGADAETLVRRADVSMYASKDTHTPIVYAAEFDNHSLARLALVGELRRALSGHELVVHYQPQAALATGQIGKVEALVRWHHPVHGMLGPDRFIPLAEQTGLIRAVTRYVLDTALGQCRAWRQQGREMRVAVNITARELLDLGFPDEVAELLARWEVDPAMLELEITENTIMTDPHRSRAILDRLRGLGVRLAVDDFGSGHSSLGYLRRLPIDVLKIDKSFVQNMAADTGDAAVVRSAIDLGLSLGLEVVAEGVETEQDRRRLAELGCTTYQGYLLSRPQAADVLFGPPADADSRGAA